MGHSHSKADRTTDSSSSVSDAALGPFTLEEYESLQKQFSQLQCTEKSAEGVPESSSELTFVDRLLHTLDLDPKFKHTIAGLFGVTEDAKDVSFGEYQAILGELLHGSNQQVRMRLYAAAKTGGFQKLFELLVFCWEEKTSDIDVSHLVKGLQGYVASHGGFAENIQPADFSRWYEHSAPSLADPLRQYIVNHSTKGAEKPRNSLQAGKREGVSLRAEIVFAFKCCSDIFKARWDKLFSSATDGLSFENLTYSLIGYGGPTLVVITDVQGNIFGALTESTWKEHHDFFGDPNSIIFAIWPIFSVYRCRAVHGDYEDTRNYQYLNVKSRTKVHGLGFGGQKELKRLWLDSALEDCKAGEHCVTYEPGPLRVISGESNVETLQDLDHFVPSLIEVYGFGGDDALKAQLEHREEIAEIVQDRRKVDKKQFVQSEFDREFLLSGTFKASNEKFER